MYDARLTKLVTIQVLRRLGTLEGSEDQRISFKAAMMATGMLLNRPLEDLSLRCQGALLMHARVIQEWLQGIHCRLLADTLGQRFDKDGVLTDAPSHTGPTQRRDNCREWMLAGLRTFTVKFVIEQERVGPLEIGCASDIPSLAHTLAEILEQWPPD